MRAKHSPVPSLFSVNSPVLNYGGTRMRFNYVWLRDHCRSPSAYNSQTNQRKLDTGGVDLGIRPENATVQDGQLILTCKYSSIPIGTSGNSQTN